MNLRSITDQFASHCASLEARMAKGLKSAWAIVNYDLVENLLKPRRSIFLALDKDSLSVVYGYRLMGKSRINVCRKYAYERKPQENVSRKYVYQDGQLPKPDVLASTLDFFISEFGADRAKVTLSIPKAWTIYRTAEFPIAVQEHISDVIGYELDRLVSLTPENAYYDFKVVDQKNDYLKVAVAAARKDLIDSYIRIIEEKGLIVDKVTTSLSVASGLLSHLFGKHCFILLDVYKEDYEVAALVDGAILFAHKEKYIAEGYDQQIQAMAEDVAQLRQELNEQSRDVQIVICSDDDNPETIRDRMGLSAEILHKSNIAMHVPGYSHEADALAAAGCLDLVSRNAVSFNLLSQKDHKVYQPALRVSFALAVAAALLGVMSLFAPLIMEKVKINELENRIDMLRDDFRRIEPQKTELDNILYQIQTINELKNSKPPRILLLKEMARIIPSSHWVSKMKLAENYIEIELQSREATSEITNVLEASPYFKNVRRIKPETADKAPKDQAEFVVLHIDIENNPAMKE